MKRNRKIVSIGLTTLAVALTVFGAVSCASTGQFMPRMRYNRIAI
jgi:hypothetical protein